MITTSLPDQNYYSLHCRYAVPEAKKWLINDIKEEDGLPTGAMGALFKQMKADAGFQTERRYISAESMALSPKSNFTACTIDIRKGLVDMCIGDFWDTVERRFQCSFTAPLYNENFLLATSVSKADSTYWQMFSPFDSTLWLGILVSSVVVAVLLYAFERASNEDDYNPEKSAAENIVHSQYLSILAFFAGGFVSTPKTAAGKLVALAWAFMILICVASYTANLAAFLTASSLKAPVSGLEDAVNQQMSICTLGASEATILYVAPSAKLNLMTDSVELLDAAGQGVECKAAVTVPFTLASAQANSKACNLAVVGQPILEIPVSFPCRQDLAESLSYWIAEYRRSFVWAQALAEYKPQSQCASQAEEGTSTSTNQLTFSSLSGTFIITGTLFGAAVAMHVVTVVLAKRRQKSLVVKSAGVPHIALDVEAHH